MGKAFVATFDYIVLQLVLVPFWIIIHVTRSSCLHQHHKKNMNDWMWISKGVALRVCKWLWQLKNMLPSMLERKFFAVESKFLHILSIVARYVKSKCRALDVRHLWYFWHHKSKKKICAQYLCTTIRATHWQLFWPS